LEAITSVIQSRRRRSSYRKHRRWSATACLGLGDRSRKL